MKAAYTVYVLEENEIERVIADLQKKRFSLNLPTKKEHWDGHYHITHPRSLGSIGAIDLARMGQRGELFVLAGRNNPLEDWVEQYSWRPDQVLIDAFAKYQEAKKADMEEKSIFCPDGTEKGGNGRSLREVVQEMREGTSFGRSFYRMLYKHGRAMYMKNK